jgi:hypothetical protein
MRLVLMQWWTLVIALMVGAYFSPEAVGAVAAFDDLGLAADSYWNGSDSAGSFTSGNISFINTYNTTYESWSGWAYSSKSDTTTPGYDNQYSAITGSGLNGSSTYGLGYQGDTKPTVSFSSPTTVEGAYITNATYTYLSMKNGDSYAKKFGGTTGNDQDWFKLTITGLDSSNAATGTIDFYLADYRAVEKSGDYLIHDWTWVDLTSLGSNVQSLTFALSSTDNGSFGINTPTYFAMDNLTTVPEPSTFILALVAGLAALACRFRRCKG